MKYSGINGLDSFFKKSLLGFLHIPSCDTSRTQTFFFWVVGVFLVVLIGFARFALIELLSFSFFRCLSLVLLSFSHLLKNPLVRLGFLSPSVIERESIHGYDDIRIESNGLYSIAREPIKSVPFICAIGVASSKCSIRGSREASTTFLLLLDIL